MTPICPTVEAVNFSVLVRLDVDTDFGAALLRFAAGALSPLPRPGFNPATWPPSHL